MSRASHVPLGRSELERALVRETPLVPGPAGSRWSRVHFKLENLQRTGSFKLRGAARRLARLSREGHASVVAASAGNHGAGVAMAAAYAGMSATIVVPERTPRIKMSRMSEMGARIIVHGDTYDQAESHALALAAESGVEFVSPFDHDDIIAGNGGTLADELIARCDDLALVVCPVGGGGLIAGLADTLAPSGVRVVGVEPAEDRAMHDSLALGRALTRYEGRPTLAEGLAGAVSDRTYQPVARWGVHIALVGEDHIAQAVAASYRELGALIECSAAVAVAGFLYGGIEPADQGTTVCILTGSNIDPDLLDRFLRQ